MRLASLCGFGAALVCAAFLVACGGGGGSAPSGTGSLTGSHAASGKGAGTTMTIVINRGAHTKATHTPRFGAGHARAQASKRNPKFIDTDDAEGLQVTVSGTGVASQTIYADISDTSPLCTTTSNVETCTLSVPTISASEQFAVLETDNRPTGATNGYGTGFATGTDILGALQQSATITLGAPNSVALEVGPVAAFLYDCSGNFTPPTPIPGSYSANFGVDGTGIDRNFQARIVVTTNTTVTGSVVPQFQDEDNCEFDSDTTPAPFVDVNGSPTPITLTSNNSALTVAPVINNGTAPPASAYTSSASIPNDGYYWEGCFFVVGVNVASTLSSPQTLTLSNNLSAIPPFTATAYTATYTYTVVPISVTPTSISALTPSGTATVTGNDYGAFYGMVGSSSYSNYDDGNCDTSGGVPLATVASSSGIGAPNWTQTFTVTGNGSGTTGQTCTFYLSDDEAGTITQAVTVTI